MNLIDWILNLAAIVLWVDWRAGRASQSKPSVLSLASAVRPAGTRGGRGLGSLGTLLAILLIRPFFYWSIGSKLQWTARTDLLAISLPWRSDLLDRMFLYSTLSFLLAFGAYYTCLLLVSAVNHGLAEANWGERFVRAQLGWAQYLPWWFKLLLPICAAALGWAALAPLSVRIGLLPPIRDGEELWMQSLALGLATMLIWKWLLGAIFLVHFLNLYIYLGNHPFWEYISLTARRLLLPISFFRSGRIDLSPLVGIAAAWVLADYAIKPAVIQLFEKAML